MTSSDLRCCFTNITSLMWSLGWIFTIFCCMQNAFFYFFAFSLYIFFLLFWFLNGTRDLLCPQIVCSAVAKISNEKQDLRNNDCVFLVAISIQWSALNANTWNQSPQEIGRLTTKICNTNFISCILLLFGLFLWHFLCRKQYSSASEL